VTFIEPPLFDLPAGPAVSIKTPRQLARELKPRWSRHTGKRWPCDECVRQLHAAAGVGPLPRGATMVRTVAATGDVQRLCPDHGGALKAVDQPARRRGRVKL
jgi:hypothetical protein